MIKLLENSNRVIFCDTTGHDYNDGVVFYNLADLKKFWVKVYLKNFRIIYRPLDPQKEFPELCKLCIECKDLSLVVEELDIYCQNGKTCDEFFEIIRRGRHHGIELIGVSQRPHGFGRDVTSQTKEFYIFSTNEPKDIQYFKEYFGEYIVDQIGKLQQYEYVKAVEPFNNENITIGKDTI